MSFTPILLETLVQGYPLIRLSCLANVTRVAINLEIWLSCYTCIHRPILIKHSSKITILNQLGIVSMINLLRKKYPANRDALHLGTFLPTETSVISTMSTLEFSVIRLARLLPLSEVIAPPLTWSTTLVEKRIVWLQLLNISHIAWTFTWCSSFQHLAAT